MRYATDIPIKLKAYEKTAIDYLNRNALEIYQEKNPEFRWASHTAVRKSGIDRERTNRIRIENEFSSEGFGDNDSSISHLTIDDQIYEKLRNDTNQQLNTTRGVQKAPLVRAIIKQGPEEMKPIVRLTSYVHLVHGDKQDLSNADALKFCVDLLCDSGGDSDRAEIREQIRKLLMDYQKKMGGK